MAYIKKAKLLGNAWAGEGAVVIGNVTVGDESSIWYNAVVRGDQAEVTIGSGTNIQDGAVVHCSTGCPCHIGNGVSVGHNAIVHGCSIGHNTLIGMGAVVMDGACVGEDCIIGAGSLVTGGTVIPDGMLAFGSPAKVIRPLTDEEKKDNQTNAIAYMMMKTVQ
ncbi:MAG: gamma carbonic anhydrase family protein [Eubacterium sp.]|nr:gamma carbonic anhydrase family protein [Eubacterium sp.]